MKPQSKIPFDLKKLAIGCAYLLAGKGTLDFPGSTRAAPSLIVMVGRTTDSPSYTGDDFYFPFFVPWYIWQNTVVPVLQTHGLKERVRESFSLPFDQNAYETILTEIEALFESQPVVG